MSEFVDCRTCKSDCVRADGNYGYTFCDKYTHPPMTNADRIRSMSDEELAAFLTEVEYRRSAAGGGAKWKIVPNTLAWLHQPAEERKLCD